MSTVHSSNRHYREEFEPPKPGLVLPVWVGVGVVGLVAFAALHAGAWLERQVTPAPEVRIVAAPRFKAPLTQWQCTRQEFAEYREACKQRAFSAMTKPNKE